MIEQLDRQRCPPMKWNLFKVYCEDLYLVLLMGVDGEFHAMRERKIEEGILIVVCFDTSTSAQYFIFLKQDWMHIQRSIKLTCSDQLVLDSK
jgi:hypothetical protein